MPVTFFEVHYDDSEVYHVAGRFSDRAAAQRWRDRLAAAHVAADLDGCGGLDNDWSVVELRIDTVDPEQWIAPGVFDVDTDGHAEVDGFALLDRYGDSGPRSES